MAAVEEKELCNVLYQRYVKHKVSHLQFRWFVGQVKSPHVSSLKEEHISGSWKAVSLKRWCQLNDSRNHLFNAFSNAIDQGPLILHCVHYIWKAFHPQEWQFSPQSDAKTVSCSPS